MVNRGPPSAGRKQRLKTGRPKASRSSAQLRLIDPSRCAALVRIRIICHGKQIFHSPHFARVQNVPWLRGTSTHLQTVGLRHVSRFSNIFRDKFCSSSQISCQGPAANHYFENRARAFRSRCPPRRKRESQPCVSGCDALRSRLRC